MDLITVLYGVCGGLGWSVLGLAKEKTKENSEDFDTKKFLKSIILGGIVGGVVASTGTIVSGTTIESFVAESSSYGLITAGVDKILGIVYELIKKIFH